MRQNTTMSTAPSPIDGWTLIKITGSCFLFGTMVLGLLVYSIRDKWVPAGSSYLMAYPSQISGSELGHLTDFKMNLSQPHNILPRAGNFCQGIPAPVNFTFVTSLFGIEEGGWSENLKIDRKELLETFAQLLQFNSRMTIFTEEAMKPFIMYHRQGKENITHVIGTKITDLEYYPYYSRIKEIMGSREFQKDFPYADEPRGYSPEYDIITNSKFSLLGKAAQENYFHTPYLFWIDSIYPEESHFPKTCSWMPLRGFQDKISIIAPNSEVSSLTSVSDIYKHQNWAFTTGLLGGSANAIQQMYTLHKQVLLTEFLDKNHVDDDTVLITATYLNNPELFSIAIGTYGDAFKLFN